MAHGAQVAADAKGIHGKHELCRRIRRLAVKDSKGRSAPVLERLMSDPELAVMVRLEAARALERFGSPRLLDIAQRLLPSPAEIPALKVPLQELVLRKRNAERRSAVSGLTPMPALTGSRS